MVTSNRQKERAVEEDFWKKLNFKQTDLGEYRHEDSIYFDVY